MTTTDFTTTLVVDKSANEVFNAINNARAWWSEEIQGNTEKVNDIFNYHFEDIHRCKIKITESIPNQKVSWLVMENYFKPGIFENQEHPPVSADGFDKTEWINTMVLFEVSEIDGKSQLKFTHQGLTPEYECYDVCANGWSHYIGESLKELIVTGTGHPNKTGKPMTSDEERFHAN